MRVGGGLRFLDARRAALAALLMCYVFVPIINTIEGFNLDAETLISRYIGTRSRFRSVLNPRYCREHGDVCRGFYSRYVERPFDGFIVKRYAGESSWL